MNESAQYARQIRNTIWGVLIVLLIAGAVFGASQLMKHNQSEESHAEQQLQCVQTTPNEDLARCR